MRHRLAITIITAMFGITACSGNVSPPKVQLNVTTVSQIQQGNPLELTLSLENIGAVDTVVSSAQHGTIIIESFTRDGVNIVPRQSEAHYVSGLLDIIDNARHNIAPGAIITVQWSAIMDPEQNGYALQSVQLGRRGAHPTWLFSIDQPGSYTLAVYYHYPLSTPLGNNLYRGQTNTATVNFTVTP